MMFATHLHMGSYLHERLVKKAELDFKIQRWLFIYGNVKPDITMMVFLKHQLDSTGELFLQQLEIVTDTNNSSARRSIALGVVTHFICDYFCKYHSKRPYNEYSKWHHFWYEWQLHWVVANDLATLRLLFDHDIAAMENQSRSDSRIQNDTPPGSDVLGEIGALVNIYLKNKDTPQVDRDFALYAINETYANLLGIRLFSVVPGDQFSFANGNYEFDDEESILDKMMLRR